MKRPRRAAARREEFFTYQGDIHVGFRPVCLQNKTRGQSNYLACVFSDLVVQERPSEYVQYLPQQINRDGFYDSVAPVVDIECPDLLTEYRPRRDGSVI